MYKQTRTYTLAHIHRSVDVLTQQAQKFQTLGLKRRGRAYIYIYKYLYMYTQTEVQRTS